MCWPSADERADRMKKGSGPGRARTRPARRGTAMGNELLRLFSENATAVGARLFDGLGARGGGSGSATAISFVWHGYRPDVAPRPALRYRSWHGPYAPAEGHRINAAKLLVDPYCEGPPRPVPLGRRAPRLRGSADPDGPRTRPTARRLGPALRGRRERVFRPGRRTGARARRGIRTVHLRRAHVRGHTEAPSRTYPRKKKRKKKK
jgi:hypothetical protein